MDLATADRLQFAFTIMFHYLFPIGTMGLAPFVAWYVFRGARGDAEAERIARFLTKIFAINFGAGVVTGIPMEFQFGTNWAAFADRSGSVLGQPLGLESIYAFFLESVFLGVLLYGRGRVPANWYVGSAVCVWLGSWLSGFFIVALDAWMQHPVGYRLTEAGRIELTDLGAILTSRFAWWQFAHVLTGAIVAGGFIIAGIGAYYLLARRDESIGGRFVRAGVFVAFIASCVAVFPTGDRNSIDVTEFQPIKLAAMEGLFASTKGAPLAIIGMPDVARRDLIDPIFVPDLLSFLAYGHLSANVEGLNNYATELWPPVELTYYAYHVMVGLGTIFVAVAGVGVVLLWRGLVYGYRPLLWMLMLLMPFPYIANEAGWTVTEVGRQPWIIYGVMKTVDGISGNIAQGEAVFTLIGFLGMYFMLGFFFLWMVLREIGLGPEHG